MGKIPVLRFFYFPIGSSGISLASPRLCTHLYKIISKDFSVKIFYVYVVLSVGVFFFPAKAFTKSVSSPDLFEPSRTRSTELKTNPSAIKVLRESTQTVSLGNIPTLSGDVAKFDFEHDSPFTSDARVYLRESDGTSVTLPLNAPRSWYGKDPDNPRRTAFLSLNAQDEIYLYIAGDGKTSATLIQSIASSQTSKVKTPSEPPARFCTMEIPDIPADLRPAPVPQNQNAPRDLTDTIYEVELTLDITTQLYNRLTHNNVTSEEYVANLVGATNVIYRRDLGLLLKVNNLHVWNSSQPFTANLDNYRTWVTSNRPALSYDLSHQLGYNPSSGGIAYLDVIGGINAYRVGISHVHGDNDFPADESAYYWDIVVFAHELGHNLGSDHTHCYNPPIDCCVTECSVCPTAVPAAGTLMSYCHLTMNQGGSMEMEFHPRTINVIRPKIVSSSLLTARPNAPEIIVKDYDGHRIESLTAGKMLSAGQPNSYSYTATYTILNNGNRPLILTGNTPVSISSNPNFSIAAQPSLNTLPPGAETTFQVTFHPVSYGVHTANITLIGNDEINSPFSFSISGKGAKIGTPAISTKPSNSGWSILKNGNFTNQDLPISGVQGLVMKVELELNGFSGCTAAAISHGNIKDLILKLRSPDGTERFIFNRPGSTTAGGANICEVQFRDDSALPSFQNVSSANAPFYGAYRPAESLDAFTGESPNGTWRLSITDMGSQSTGYIRGITLRVFGEDLSTVSNWSVY